MILPWWTSTEPIGIPPSARLFLASSIAATKKRIFWHSKRIPGDGYILSSTRNPINGNPVERRLLMRLLSLSLLFLIPAVLPAQHSYTPADIQEGGRLFRANCVLCHGPEGDQVPGIDLGHGRFRQTYSENALIKIIQNGIPGTGMPPNNLQDFQAEIVLAYLHSLATSRPHGHRQRRCRARQSALRRQSQLRQLPSREWRRLARRSGSERYRRPAPHGRNRAVSARAE